MVGDREHDTLGAKTVGVKCAGALWGIGSREELLSTGAVGVFEDPMEPANAILSDKI